MTVGHVCLVTNLGTEYIDTNFASNINMHCSYAGYLFLQCSGPMAWDTKLLPKPSLSTLELEYMAMTWAAQQLKWMYAQISEMGLPQSCPAIL